jgi:sensor histidine kinase regulating citrate/malate metabolism
VVFSLIELDEYKDARDYIEHVYGDIQRVSNVLKTSLPAVNALIQSKFYTCEKLGINAVLNSTSQLNGLPVPSWEMCRVLGNLIDNAIFALKNMNGEKNLDIYLFEDIRSFGFKIRDNGPCIRSEMLERIFDPGFSTKGAEGQGMGLSITKNILKAYNGSIWVTSNETETIFEGTIPKRI